MILQVDSYACYKYDELIHQVGNWSWNFFMAGVLFQSIQHVEHSCVFVGIGTQAETTEYWKLAQGTAVVKESNALRHSGENFNQLRNEDEDTPALENSPDDDDIRFSYQICNTMLLFYWFLYRLCNLCGSEHRNMAYKPYFLGKDVGEPGSARTRLANLLNLLLFPNSVLHGSCHSFSSCLSCNSFLAQVE